MPPDVKPVPLPQWRPHPHPECRGVEVKVLLRRDELALAMLRFAPNGTIHEHPATIDIDVVCLEGEGMTSVSGESAPIRAGEAVRWPKGQPHRLWTEASAMITLMVERLPPGPV